VLETDTLDYAISICISQSDNEERLRPIAFYSRKMIPMELNYEIHDKELLAIITTFSEWRVYLKGSKYLVEVWTDHKNLLYFTTTKALTRRQVRWPDRKGQPSDWTIPALLRQLSTKQLGDITTIGPVRL
jgi:RNase H-like domain found in reverse transcriptase